MNSTQGSIPRWHEFWENKVTAADQNGYLKFMVGEETHESAIKMHEEDVMELTRYYPDLEGKDVLELAAGIGRFTGELAKRARHVTATDLIQDFVEENRKTNGSVYSNTTFRTLDAAILDYPSNSFDFVTALWLLQFLTDSQLEEFIAKMVRILRPGGYLLFRDTHYNPCAVLSRKTAGIYRTIIEYLTFYSKCSYLADDGLLYGFDIEVYFNSKAWINLRHTPMVFNYRVKKVPLKSLLVMDNPHGLASQYLYSHMYNKDSLTIYKEVLDEGFAFPGGLMISEKLALDLKRFMEKRPEPLTVLDVGCGFGGFGLHLLQQNYNLDTVTFLEKSAFACESLALLLLERKSNKGQICLTKDLAHLPQACSYDCISFVHSLDFMENKMILLNHAKRLLKPGGIVLIGSFCLSDNVVSGNDSIGIDSNHSLVTAKTITEYLNEIGFNNVTSTDYSDEMLHCIQTAIDRLKQVNVSALQSIQDVLYSKWNQQAEYLRKKEMSWLNFIAYSS